MAVKATLLVQGEATPREIYITRSIAVRVYCDCHVHALRREAWVFVIALDRDTGDAYTRRGDALDTEPWRRADQWGPMELEICKTRFEIDGVTNVPTQDQDPDLDLDPRSGSDPAPAGEAAPAQPAGDSSDQVRAIQWYGEAPHAQLKFQKRADQGESEFERAKRDGLVDGYEKDAPKESDARRRRRERKQAAYVQPSLGGIDLDPPIEAVHGGRDEER